MSGRVGAMVPAGRDGGGVAGARRRHPSTRAPVPSEAVRDRMAFVLEQGGARHPDVAAAVLSARGRSGLGPEAFARRWGVPPSVLATAEAGDVALCELPGPLRRAVSAGS